MEDPWDFVLYVYIWFVGWLITANILLFSLRYRLHDFYIYPLLWTLAVLICFIIYPCTPKIINLFIKNPHKKIKILFETEEWHGPWYFLGAPILHGITSLAILLSYASLDGNLDHMYLGTPNWLPYSYDIDRMYLFYGNLWPVMWSISALFWFFILPLLSTTGNWLYNQEIMKSTEDKEEYLKFFAKPKDTLITFSFSRYDLHHYDTFIDLINKSAAYDNFYIILPFQLRCLFENLLYDIFLGSLHNSHKELYYLKSQNRARDFSQLIHLLNFLKEREFKPYVRDSINQKTIDILNEVQTIGNYSVHDVIRMVTKKFPKEIKDKVNLVLEPLLVSYKKLKGENIKIEDKDRELKIKEKLGIKKNI